MKISKHKSHFLDDLLPGFDSHVAPRSIYNSERNDVEVCKVCKLNLIRSR